jgi:hypothetical protein
MILVGIVDTKTAVQGFGNSSIWLIAMAFFISRGFVKTAPIVIGWVIQAMMVDTKIANINQA